MPTHFFWSQISPPRAHEILLSAQETNKKLYRTAVDVMSPNIGLRPHRVLEMPKVERHAVFAQMLARPQLEALSFNLISHWLIENHSDLLALWLDTLKIPHDGRGCANSFPPCPDEAVLREGMKTLLDKYEPELVSMYLHAFNEIDEVHWQKLQDLLAHEPRLQPATA
jgi:hypothetical protein